VVALYITSTASAGKTAFCAGIAQKLLDGGSKIGFMMPVHTSQVGETNGCGDAIFVREVLKLAESEELLCPIRLSQQELWRNLTEDEGNFSRNLKEAYGKVSQGKDVVVMEGLGNLDIDKVSMLASHTIAEALAAKVVILINYSSRLNVPQIAQKGNKIGNLIGVIINLVPASKIDRVKRDLTNAFDKEGIAVFGVCPEVRSLLGITVNELAKTLDGEILTALNKVDEIVENVMLGAMTVDSGVTYYSRKENKAVVVRGERADMQIAALQTPTRCLIVTNGVKPLPVVVVQAEEKQVPIIMVKQDTSTAVAVIEKALVQSSFRSRQKLETFKKILDNCLDFEALYSGLGLKA
jgi:uncharacterized protein